MAGSTAMVVGQAARADPAEDRVLGQDEPPRAARWPGWGGVKASTPRPSTLGGYGFFLIRDL
jgi:hypothetical protein